MEINQWVKPDCSLEISIFCLQYFDVSELVYYSASF